jgi:hypothetical protein
MKYLKTYQLFEARTGLSTDQEEFLNKHTKGTWTYDPSTGLVDVDGDFYCMWKRLEDFKGVQFGKVSGDFEYAENSLTSLEGAPQEVGGNFSCSGNRLTSLEGAPQKVGGSFYCQDNNLTSLVGAPQEVGPDNKPTSLEGSPQKVVGDFNCSGNNLTSLEGSPQKVVGDFDCSSNNLTSLEGSPQKVGGDFGCSFNNLTSLEGAPQKVGGTFGCGRNYLTSLEGAPQEVWYFSCPDNKLTTLKGAPQKVGDVFWCEKNNLTSLEGAPQEVGGKFICDAFELWREDWNLRGWLHLLGSQFSPKASSLVSTLISPEDLNKEIAKDPAGMVIKLKGVWNDEVFKKTRAKLVWPKGLGEEADLVGDLDDVGF